MEEKQFTLKHSVQPYAVIGGVLSIITILALVDGFLVGIWDGFLGMLVVMAVYFLKIYSYDLRYTISFNNNSVVMHVATWSDTPAASTTIKVADITSIQRETSDLRAIATQQRVTQRIAIYDDTHKKFIDISLKHFTRDSIRQLMQTIRSLRPELQIPDGWL